MAVPGRNVSSFIASYADEVTPHDTDPNVWSYLYVGGSGDISLTTEDGTDVVYKNVPAGSMLWIRTSKIKTSTTATYIVGHR
jgi:hypothetical protein